MKVVVIQSEAIGGIPKYEDLMAEWYRQFENISGVDDVQYYKGFNLSNIEEIIGDADAVLGVWIRENLITEEFLDRHPNLKYIATFAHGFGTFDLKATKRRGVTITNTVYGDITIAQYAMALLLDICHGVSLHDNYYKNEIWKSKDKTFGLRVLTRQIELYEKTFGIVGLGNIGLCAARMAQGFGMKVIAYSRTKKEGTEYSFIKQVSLDELLEQSDVISLHAPFNPGSANMINKDTIAKMKKGVILINTARGGLINEPDLIEALNSGKVYAAGLDVVVGEPLQERCALMDCRNTRITQHIAWAPSESRIRAIKIAAENFKNWLNGNPSSVINK